MSACRGIFQWVRQVLLSFRDDERGFVLALGVFLVPVLVFAAGLVIDVGFSLQERSKAQAAADFAAIAGAEMLAIQGMQLSDAQNTAYAIAKKNGYASGVSANYPWNFSPAYGNYASTTNNYTFEVRISTTKNNIFGSIFSYITTNIGVRAVASFQSAYPCIVVLNNTASPASNPGLKVSGSGSNLVTPCGIYINTPDMSSAVNVNSGSLCGSPHAIPAGYGVINANGGAGGQNLSGICAAMSVRTGLGQIVPNPYASLDPASAAAGVGVRPNFSYSSSDRASGTGNISNGSFDSKNCKSGGGCTMTYTVSPGRYPNGFSVNFTGNAASLIINFNPGVYFIGGSGLFLKGASLTANANIGGGAVIALTDPNNGTINLQAGATFNLNAPTDSSISSPFAANFAVVQSPPTTTGNPVNGGTGGTFNVNGLVVLPNTNLTLTSGGTSSSVCTGFIVWTLTVLGNATIVDGCQISNQNTTGLKSAILVE